MYSDDYADEYYTGAMEREFPAGVIAKAKEHAIAEAPAESCGLIVKGRKTAYIPCFNSAKIKTDDFRISAAEFARAVGDRRVLAIIHSHTNQEQLSGPSYKDMKAQKTNKIPWGIVWVKNGQAGEMFFWGDGVPVMPYIGRPFVHGIFDCYALVRDFYKCEFDISLPHVLRGIGWWDEGEDLLLEGFSPAGFREVESPEYGDVLIGKIRGKTTNHSAVYIGSGLILHHFYKRLSRREPLGPWRKYATAILRHESRS